MRIRSLHKSCTAGLAILLVVGVRMEGQPVGGGNSSQRDPSVARAANQSISGYIRDETGGVIPGAKITIKGPDGLEHSVDSDARGRFAFSRVQPGKFDISATAANFAAYQGSSVAVRPGLESIVNITLRLSLRTEQVTVLSANPLLRGATYSGGSFILSGEALDQIPDGPGGLEAMLRALAVRTAGPFGPQVLVNGFEDNPIPTTHSIREIRINDNPLSAEYAKLGLGRVEVFTKPGTDKFHGELFSNFSDGNLNTRNPFAANHAPYQARFFGGNVSGPIVPKRATFFVDFGRQDTRSNAVINANVLDPAFRITPLDLAVVAPERRISIAPRLDLQLNSRNTLVARYAYTRDHLLNSGVGEFSLPSRAQKIDIGTHTLQLTETSTLSSKLINEARFQYLRSTQSGAANNSIPVINVPGSFIGGGADQGLSYDNRDRYEFHNVTSWTSGRHVMKAGFDAQYIYLSNGSTQNFGGTYTFAGRTAPLLDANYDLAGDVGQAALAPISGIEAYRRTLLFQNLGLSPAEIRRLGGGASQFSLNAGQVGLGLGQAEIGAFLQDNWLIVPGFSLSAGLRYENQTNVSSNWNFGPRLGFRWNVDGASGSPKTVVRGGVGVFYERIGQQLVLRARRFNGTNQQQYIISDPTVLDLFPVVPKEIQLAGSITPQSLVRVASGAQAPYIVNSSFSIERQFPRGFSAAATYNNLYSVHVLRSRDINALAPGFASRPYPGYGGIFQYETTGRLNQNQILTNLVYRASKSMTFWTTYTLTGSRTDTDGPDVFPADNYNLSPEVGRSALTARHTFYWGGWIRTPGKFELTPLFLCRSGLPFNIVTGRDSSGDSLFSDRPTLASGVSGANVVVTPYGAFNLAPLSSAQVIPRNFGTGPNFVIANLRVSRKFPLNERLALLFAVQGWNILNHTNAGTPVGNLGSPLFGISNTAAGDWGLGSNQAGNRRLELWLYLEF